ncbi:MAG: hypothetical protein HQK52_16745 [Oligoflexia bacterium]|nr:hypothetical protein [Oligoflexia bacterium]
MNAYNGQSLYSIAVGGTLSSSLEQKLGKKAYNLHLLTNHGYPVPKAQVITYEQFQLLQQNRAETQEEILQEIIDQIGGFPVAVRSSGQFEDLANASFAGLYETFLDVDSLQTLIQSLNNCFLSAESERVLSYVNNKKININPQELKSKLSVVIQKMVPAKYAGVAFSMNPLTGQEEHFLLEVCHGLGEKLVSGHTTPTQYVVDYRNLKVISHESGDEQVILNQQQVYALAATILDIQSRFQHPQDIEWAIDQENQLWVLQTRPITTINWRIDVEELTNADLKDGGVSARACTPMMYSLYELSFAPSMSSYFERINLPLDVSPQELMPYYYARVYWNAGAIKRALQNVPGFHEESFDRDIGIQKDYGSKGAFVAPNNFKTIIAGLRALWGINREYDRCIDMVEEYKLNFDEIDKKNLISAGILSTLSTYELFKSFFDVISDYYLTTERSYFRTIYNNSNFQNGFKDFMRKLDKETKGETSLIDLMSGLSEVSHLEIQKGINALYIIAKEHGIDSSPWQNELQNFLKIHYHHGPSELDLMTERWGERPEMIKEMIAVFLQNEQEISLNNPRQSEQTQKKRYTEAQQSLFKRIDNSSLLFLKKFYYKQRFKKLISRLRYFLVNREKMREFSTRSYYVVRLYILEIGKRLQNLGLTTEVNDVFFFEVSELLQLSLEIIDVKRERMLSTCALQSGGRCNTTSPQQTYDNNNSSSLIMENDDDALIKEILCERINFLLPALVYRKKIFLGLKNLDAPNEFGRGIRGLTEDSFIQKNSDNKTIFKGIGCSPGTYTGKVRVILSLNEANTICPGEILVTKFTDPGWTAILGLVSAVVTEVGGVLSHAAVIGREYGIPAVLNIKGITKHLTTGQIIHIDGNKGEVTLVE